MSSLIGTRHLPDFRGSILIIEDIGEAPYRIDRMLTHLRLAGILHQLSGLAFGSFTSCDEDKDVEKTKSFDLLDVFRDRTQDLKIPIVSNLPVGHCHGNASLPLGNQAILNGDKGLLSFS